MLVVHLHPFASPCQKALVALHELDVRLRDRSCDDHLRTPMPKIVDCGTAPHRELTPPGRPADTDALEPVR
jgi:hypothetical protein